MINKSKNINKPYKIANKSEEVLHDLFKKRGFPDAKIPLIWKEIVGNDIANVTKPVKISWQQQKNIQQRYLKRKYVASKSEVNKLDDFAIDENINNQNSLKKSHYQACLHLNIHKGKMLFYQHQIPKIIEKINNFYGYDLIKSIKLIASNEKVIKNKSTLNDDNYEVIAPNNKPNDIIAEIKDDTNPKSDSTSLREALKKLNQNYKLSK